MHSRKGIPMKEPGKKKLMHFLLGFAIILAVICLLGDAAALIIQNIGGISFPVNPSSSIGIIGGADGPTAVFITAARVPIWQSVLKLIFLFAGICLWKKLKRTYKGEE